MHKDWGPDFAMTRAIIGISAAAICAAFQSFAEQNNGASEPALEDAVPVTIACAQERGEALGECSFSVKSDESGMTTVTVIFANGFKRRLMFKEGAFVKASVTMSGVGTDTDWSLEGETHIIRVEDQRYEVPDSLISRE